MAMKYELKPLKVGGILDQAILILKDRFGLFLMILLCLQIPVAIVVNLIIIDKVPVLAPNPSPEELAESLQTQLNFLVSVMMPVSFLMLLIVVPVMGGALVHAAARVYLGKPVGVRRAFRAGIIRAVPLLWTWLLMGIFMTGGLALCVLPGILMGFWFALTTTIVVVEGTSGLGAIRRSWYLMRSAWIEHYLAFFLLSILVLVINSGIGVGAAVVFERHLAGVVGSLLQAVTRAFDCIVAVVFYFSCRCRVENFDLLRLAEEVASAPTRPLATSEQT
jgi:hypothetical protein